MLRQPTHDRLVKEKQSMTTVIQAASAIGRYAYGMDTNEWERATSVYADEVDIDYRQVGAMQGRMTRTDVATFLQGLLGKSDLRVHTAISQVLEHPSDAGRFIAYYSVRHDKGAIGSAEKFALFGWYDFEMADEQITSLTVDVSATEGNPGVLA